MTKAERVRREQELAWRVANADGPAAMDDGSVMDDESVMLWERVNAQVGELEPEPELSSAARNDLAARLSAMADEVRDGEYSAIEIAEDLWSGCTGNLTTGDWEEVWLRLTERDQHIRRRYNAARRLQRGPSH